MGCSASTPKAVASPAPAAEVKPTSNKPSQPPHASHADSSAHAEDKPHAAKTTPETAPKAGSAVETNNSSNTKQAVEASKPSQAKEGQQEAADGALSTSTPPPAPATAPASDESNTKQSSPEVDQSSPEVSSPDATSSAAPGVESGPEAAQPTPAEEHASHADPAPKDDAPVDAAAPADASAPGGDAHVVAEVAAPHDKDTPTVPPPADAASTTTDLAKPAGGPALSDRAVTVSFLTSFLTAHPEAQDYSTAEVVSKIIIPATQDDTCSYAEMQLSKEVDTTNGPTYGPITYFVSHAWSCRFGELVEVLQGVFDRHKEQSNAGDAAVPFFWLDMFAINQHGGVAQATELQQLGDMLCAAKATLAVLSPWFQPVAVSRVWCLYEYVSTLHKRLVDVRELIVVICGPGAEGPGALEVHLSEKQQQEFVAHLVGRFDEVDKLISKINVRNAEASVPSDKELIEQQVHATTGIAVLNETVQMALKRWLRDSGEKVLAQLEKEQGPEAEDVLKLKDRLGMLLRAQESDAAAMTKALRYCEDVLKVRRAQDEASGVTTPSAATLTSIQNVAMILRALGDKVRALAMLKEALKGLEVVAGPADKTTLRCMNDVGYTLISSDPLKAEDVFFEALQRIEDASGPNPYSMQSLSSALSEAAATAVAAAEAAKTADDDASPTETAGSADADAAAADAAPSDAAATPADAAAPATEGAGAGGQGASPFADAAGAGEQAAQAQPSPADAGTAPPRALLKSVPSMKLPASRVPAELLDVRSSLLSNLGKAYKEQGRLKESLEVLQEAFKAKEDTYGDMHPSTIMTGADVAMTLNMLGHQGRALGAVRRCLAQSIEVLGAQHRHSAMMQNNLAAMLATRVPGGSGAHNNAAEAVLQDVVALYEKALQGFLVSRGATHPSTLTVAHNWALVRWQRQGNTEGALELVRQYTLPARQQLLAGGSGGTGSTSTPEGAAGGGMEQVAQLLDAVAAGQQPGEEVLRAAFSQLQVQLQRDAVANILVMAPK